MRRTGASYWTAARARANDSHLALAKLTRTVGGEPRIVSDPPMIVPVDELSEGDPDLEARLLGIYRRYRRSRPAHRRKLLEQASPLVDATHAFHQKALSCRRNDVVERDRFEFDFELSARPDERAVDRFFAAQATEMRVHDLAVAEVDHGFVPTARDASFTTLATDFERLNDVDHAHVRERTGQARA